MTETIVMIHGMWSGSWCWDNYRAFFEQRGFQCHTPTLRHHDVSPLDMPSKDLGRVSLRDYASRISRIFCDSSSRVKGF
jgi:non-heme chloroperoxidase